MVIFFCFFFVAVGRVIHISKGIPITLGVVKIRDSRPPVTRHIISVVLSSSV